jgi:tetratricopeptide (TPR) repeat protein
VSAVERLQGLLDAGLESLRQGRFADARAAFAAVLEASPHHPDAHYLLAHTAFLAGEMLQAEQAIGLALRYDPKRPDFHLLYGNVLQRQNRLPAAEQKFRDALRLAPGYAEGELNLGNVLADQGRTEAALAAYAAAIERKPALLVAYLNRAALLKRAGNIDGARREYARMEELFPGTAEVLYWRARLEHDAGDAAEARRRYEKLLAAHPGNAHGHNGLGALLLAQSQLAPALSHFERCLAADPEHRQALGNAAAILRHQGKLERAGALMRRLLKLVPDDMQTRLRLGRTLSEAGRYTEALLELLAVARAQPAWEEAHLAIAEVYLLLGRPQKALAANARALALQPGNFGARLNEALLTGEAGDPQTALEQLEALLEEAPAHPRVLDGMGLQLSSLNRYAEAITRFHQALERTPQDAGVHNNLSIALLATGDFANGWRHQGKKWGLRENARTRPDFVAPLWRGEPLGGKSLYVWSEQGLGDQVMFASMFPDLLAAGARCTFEVHPRLERLFARSFPQAEVVGKRPRKASPRQPDYQVPMSGLGEFLRSDAAAFPTHSGYLAANTARRLHWRTRLTALGPGLRVGISWRGGTDRTDRGLRSIPLEQWQPIVTLPGVRLVSLQYGDCRQEVEEMRANGVPLVHWQDPIDDLDDCAALLCELDLVVSVTTTVMHLAGALARPVWALVPARPGWRYLEEGERLPWYPSARLWRQATLRDWEPVIARLAQAIALFRP